MPVVYDGRIRVVPPDAVLADVDQQVQAGAQHVTFADPDFLNGAQHARRVVRTVHEQHPDLTFDCTVKVEHILAHADLWSEFAASGCLFVVSVFESLDDATLTRLDKGHTAEDAATAVRMLREHGIEIRPSWLPFTPWTTLEQVQAILTFVADHDLVGNVDPVQYTIRLLLPPGSLLLPHPDVVPHLGSYDPDRATFEWRSADPAMDELQAGWPPWSRRASRPATRSPPCTERSGTRRASTRSPSTRTGPWASRGSPSPGSAARSQPRRSWRRSCLRSVGRQRRSDSPSSPGPRCP